MILFLNSHILAINDIQVEINYYKFHIIST